MANVVSGDISGASCNDLKVDRINDAYSKLRISGLTVLPSKEDLELALVRLENMMSELEGGRNICLNYYFEDCPDPNSVTNLPRWAKDGIGSLLATRLIPDFNKAVPPQLGAQAASSISTISGRVMRDNIRKVEYPDRMPIGSGNFRYPRWARFYRPIQYPPNTCATHNMIAGETNNYSLSLVQKMEDNENIIGYTKEVSDGLTIDNDVVIGTDIDYSITAHKSSQNSVWQRVRFTIQTDQGRTLIEQVNFEVSYPQRIGQGVD